MKMEGMSNLVLGEEWNKLESPGASGGIYECPVSGCDYSCVQEYLFRHHASRHLREDRAALKEYVGTLQSAVDELVAAEDKWEDRAKRVRRRADQSDNLLRRARPFLEILQRKAPPWNSEIDTGELTALLAEIDGEKP